MQRDTLRAGGLAVVGILAVALAAATLPSTDRPTSGESGGPGAGDGGGGVPLLSNPDGSFPTVPYLTEFVLLVLLVCVLLALARVLANPRTAAKAAVAVAVLGAVGFLLTQLLAALGGPQAAPSLPGPAGLPEGTPGGGRGGGSGASGPTPPTLLLAVLLGLGLAGVALVAARSVVSDGGGGGEDETGDEGHSSAAAAVGRAAGRAADRLADSGDLDNEVFRAWREMTDLLDVPRPETKAPGEFADAAVEAGMDPEDVDELTRLFEMVRYGGRNPSPDDEQRALAVLRRIESGYTAGETGDGVGAGSEAPPTSHRTGTTRPREDG